ncbi:MAG: hypothetical protein OEZ36_12955, partial [Spirochaetota bacterium]|nr:hypothetical protein [Spirochaetota bacterium]
VAKEKGFRDGYRAFISSFMLKYHSLSRDLSSEALALDWVKNDNNRIIYEESLSRKVKQKKSEDLNAVVLAYRHGQDFLSQYKESHRYLLDKGWDGKMRYGFVPKLDLSTEFMIINLGLVNTT